MQKITIAIDGFSSTGKSTVAKQLAKHLGYIYVDSGAMYRAVTLFTMQNGWIDKDHFDVVTLVSNLSNVDISFKFNPDLGFAEVYLNGENVEKIVKLQWFHEFFTAFLIMINDVKCQWPMTQFLSNSVILSLGSMKQKN